MKEYHVLNLGAGVQSTTLYMLTQEQWFKFRYDVAVFADTQAEPKSVYTHLTYLERLNYVPIAIRTIGNLESHVKDCSNSTGHRYVSIPAFSKNDSGTLAVQQRQCTREYKIDVVEKYIRREIVGLRPKQRFSKDTHVYQYFGISLDESARAVRILKAYSGKKWATPVFPLIDMGWTRRDCVKYLSDKLPYECPRSACVFCPYHSDYEWTKMKEEDPESFQRAVEVDRSLRTGKLSHRRIKHEMYLHSKRIPLELVDFSEQPNLFSGMSRECLGMCGN